MVGQYGLCIRDYIQRHNTVLITLKLQLLDPQDAYCAGVFVPKLHNQPVTITHT